MEHAQFHVVPDGDRWKVDHLGRSLSIYETQEQAIKAARDQALAAEPSRVIVHGRDGRIEEETTFQHGPVPPGE